MLALPVVSAGCASETAMARARAAATPAEAEAVWRDALVGNPGDPEARRGLAAALLAQDRPEDACTLLDAAEAIGCWSNAVSAAAANPPRIVALVGRAELTAAPDEAREAWLRAGVAAASVIGRGDLASAWYPTLLGLAPEDAALHFGYALELEARGRLAEALREAELALDLAANADPEAVRLVERLRRGAGKAQAVARFEDLAVSAPTDAAGAVSMEVWDGRGMTATIRIEESARAATEPLEIERAIWPAGADADDVLGQVAAYAARVVCPGVRAVARLTVGARGQVSELVNADGDAVPCLSRAAEGWTFPSMVDGYLRLRFPVPWPDEAP